MGWTGRLLCLYSETSFPLTLWLWGLCEPTLFSTRFMSLFIFICSTTIISEEIASNQIAQSTFQRKRKASCLFVTFGSKGRAASFLDIWLEEGALTAWGEREWRAASWATRDVYQWDDEWESHWQIVSRDGQTNEIDYHLLRINGCLYIVRYHVPCE